MTCPRTPRGGPAIQLAAVGSVLLFATKTGLGGETWFRHVIRWFNESFLFLDEISGKAYRNGKRIK